MRALVVALCVLGSFASPAAACWMAQSIDELAQASDMIVVGRLVDIRQLPPDPWADGTTFEGTIRVERTVWSKAEDSGDLRFRWAMKSASTDIDYSNYSGSRVLWLLSRDGDGSYRGGHPERVLVLGHEPSVRLRKSERDAFRTAHTESRSKADPRLEKLDSLLDETLAGFDKGR